MRREWTEKSLLLAAIGESRDRGAEAMEAFAYRYPEGESVEERFLVHRTVFPRDFLDEFGFVTVRSQGRVELCRLELGGLVPVEEGTRAKVLRVVQEAFSPAPSKHATTFELGLGGVARCRSGAEHEQATSSVTESVPTTRRSAVRFPAAVLVERRDLGAEPGPRTGAGWLRLATRKAPRA